MNPADVEKTILQCLSENYGLDGKLTRLSGENLNYLLTRKNGGQLVVKIVDDDMPAEVVEMEAEALKYAFSSGFHLKLPKIIENKYKNITKNEKTVNGTVRQKQIKINLRTTHK